MLCAWTVSVRPFFPLLLLFLLLLLYLFQFQYCRCWNFIQKTIIWNYCYEQLCTIFQSGYLKPGSCIPSSMSMSMCVYVTASKLCKYNSITQLFCYKILHILLNCCCTRPPPLCRSIYCLDEREREKWWWWWWWRRRLVMVLHKIHNKRLYYWFVICTTFAINCLIVALLPVPSVQLYIDLCVSLQNCSTATNRERVREKE